MLFTNWLENVFLGGELAVIHEFKRPPWGGGNQFLLALIGELRRQGISVSENSIGKRTRVVLVNSFNFDFDKVRLLKDKYGFRIVHRVDGPVSVYRGLPSADFDRKIADWNRWNADATIMQSQYSADMHKTIGVEFKNVSIIRNAADPKYFHARGKSGGYVGKIKIGGTSWSTNPKKGLAIYKYLDENLDFKKYDLSFMGRIEGEFKNVKVYRPGSSRKVGNFLRKQNIYLMPSENECCSNALIEAIACRLPIVFKRSGSSPEIAAHSGVGYDRDEGVIRAIENVNENLSGYFALTKNDFESLASVASKYRKVLGI